MEIRPLQLIGAYEILLKPAIDARGYFVRVYDEGTFQAHGLVSEWKQVNQSLSKRRGTVRGLHFQRPPHAETKLVQAVVGTIFDVIVDLRRSSSTYGRWVAIELSDTNHRMLYVPKGLAHGYCTLTTAALVQYKVDSEYAPQAEGGVRWDDPELNIPWPADRAFLSEKDRALPVLSQLVSPFP